VNTDIWYGKNIREQQVTLKETEVLLYKRELVKDIKTAYFNYLGANEAVKIYRSALQVMEQNVKVNQSLLNNGKAVQAQMLRSQSELASIQVQLKQAENQLQNAQTYFNFLLNRDFKTSIPVDYDVNITLQQLDFQLDSAQIARREEIKMMLLGEQLHQTSAQMTSKYWAPKLSLFADLGSQSENWKFDQRSRYYLIGVQLEMPLYNGLRNRYAYRSSLYDVQSAALQTRYTSNQLYLAAEIARNNQNTAVERWKAAEKQVEAAQAYFRLIERGFAEGINSLIEFIDARNQATIAAINLTVSKYEVLKAQAQLERETASYTF
jgi:outer membrane protein TolC